MRQWLLIRDAVVSWYLYNKMLQDSQVRGLEQQIVSGIQRENVRQEALDDAKELRRLPNELSEKVERSGLPELEPETISGRRIQQLHIGHEAFEGLEIFADLLPHAAHHIVEAIGPYAGAVAMPLAVLAGLLEVGEAHEAGNRDAERNAYRYGFACALVYDHIHNQLPSRSVLGEKQLLGQQAANRMLYGLKPGVRDKFLQLYRGPEQYPRQNIDRALHDVGATN